MAPNRRLSVALGAFFLAAQIFAQAPVAAPAITPVLDDATIAAIKAEGLDRSQVMRLLEDLTGKIGHRLTGSDNFTKACDWAKAEFERMGLQNVHKEKWGEWKLVWNRGTWKGRIVQPVELDLYVATEAWTASTNGPKRGRLVRAPKNDEEYAAIEQQLKGAWLFGKKPTAELRTRCEAAGILGWASKAAGDAKYPNRVRVFGNHRLAQGSIDAVPTVPQFVIQGDHAEELEKLLDDGKDVICEFQLDSEFKAGPIELNNVVAEIPGSEHPDEVVIVCGHLDSWHQAQGCTDNGTGTTSTMESARILAAIKAKPKRTIRFILWGGEEQGLLGSVDYVKKHRAEMDKISCVFNHDTGTNWAQRLSVTEKMYEPMQRVMAPVMSLQAPDADWDGKVFDLRKVQTISGGGGSDHASFIAARVPGLDWGLRGRSDYFGYTWHSQWDKLDVAIPEYQRHTSTVIALAALGVANLPELLDHSGVTAGGGGRQSGNIAGAFFGAEFDGLKLTAVEKGGRADKLGMKVGDVLQKAAGNEVTALFDLFRIARDLEGKDSMELELKRGDKTVRFDLKLNELRNMPTGRRGNPGGGEAGGTRRGGQSGGERGGAAPATGSGNNNGGGEDRSDAAQLPLESSDRR